MARGIGDVIKDVGTGIFNRTLGRLRGAGIGEKNRLKSATAKWNGRAEKNDWRVKLQVPSNSPLLDFYFTDNELLAPLREGRGFFWPLTPVMQIQHVANYDTLTQTHSNYPHYAYQSSAIDAFNILGEFPVQNSEDAKYCIAVVNFLRVSTKMFFGADDRNKGNPPPVLHLSAYGDHMFNKVPVVIQNFTVELRQNIDYISTKQGNTTDTQSQDFISRTFPGFDFQKFLKGDQANEDSNYQSWAPSLSNITCIVQPIYSRDSVKNFDMSKFARGELNGKGRDEIGYI